jgi:hypothetical protein
VSVIVGILATTRDERAHQRGGMYTSKLAGSGLTDLFKRSARSSPYTRQPFAPRQFTSDRGGSSRPGRGPGLGHRLGAQDQASVTVFGVVGVQRDLVDQLGRRQLGGD